MSLKVFHILFISLSVLLSFGVAVWELQSFLVEGHLVDALVAVFFAVAGVGLVFYGKRFLQKFKHLRTF